MSPSRLDESLSAPCSLMFQCLRSSSDRSEYIHRKACLRLDFMRNQLSSPTHPTTPHEWPSLAETALSRSNTNTTLFRVRTNRPTNRIRHGLPMASPALHYTSNPHTLDTFLCPLPHDPCTTKERCLACTICSDTSPAMFTRTQRVHLSHFFLPLKLQTHHTPTPPHGAWRL